MRIERGSVLWCLSICTVATGVFAQTPVAEQRSLGETLAPRIEREMNRQKLVGLAVAIAEGEHGVVYTGAFGFEDREQSIATTDATMFRWASVSKPVTAVAAMQLVEDGKLDLNADVRILVPEFPAKPHPITTLQLLCHQGGIVHYANGPVVRTKREYTDPHPFKDLVLALDTFKESPLVGEPGASYQYTTHGYILLGAVVQRAAGEDFAALVKRRICEPLGMTSMRPDYQWEDIPHRAKGYRRERSAEVVASTDTDVSWKLPGGGWISTASDMARFGAGMLGDKLVTEATRQTMWTERVAGDEKPTHYGLGFRVSERAGDRLISHSGSQEKTATFLLIAPDWGRGGVSVAVMCNTEDTGLGDLANDLAELYTKYAPEADQ